jgi:hypothetical protein
MLGVLLTIKREKVINMAYKHTNSKGVTYYLNSKEVTLRGGKVQTIYYFSKDQRPEGCELPAGFVVNENPRNGFLTSQAREIAILTSIALKVKHLLLAYVS